MILDKNNLPDADKHLLPKSATTYEWKALIVDLMKQCANECGTINYNLFRNWIPDRNLAATASRVFGSWNNALRAAGFPVKKRWRINDTFILNTIRKAYKDNGYVTYDTFNKAADYNIHISTIERHFGSWRRAMELAGVPLNYVFGRKNKVPKRVRANDGHICDSIGEAVIDNLLAEHNIEHIQQKHYPKHDVFNDNELLRCDFYLPEYDLYIEFAGFEEVTNNGKSSKWSKKIGSVYNKRMERKRALSHELGLNLLIIFNKDLKDKEKIIKTILNFKRRNTEG